MEDKKAAAVLIKLLNKKIINAEEKEALKSAIGLLSWTALSKSRIKSIKAKQDKSVKWQ